MDFIKNFNWVDILLAGVLVRVIFIGIKTGFIVEFFKSWGVLFSVFITLHYYSVISNLIAPNILILEPTAIEILIFISLWAIVTLLFKIIRDGFMVLFSIKPHQYIDQWVGAAVAVFRGLMVCSLIFFLFLLSHNAYILKLSENSFSKYIVSRLATGIYSSIHGGIVVKFFPTELSNESAFVVLEQIEEKKK